MEHCLNGSGTTYNIGDLVNVGNTSVLYAQWNKIAFEVELQSNNSKVRSIYVKKGSGFYSTSELTTKITSVSTPTAETGYTFGGYFTKQNGEGTKIIDENGNIVGSNNFTSTDTIIYAFWEGNKYTVSFNSNGCSQVSAVTVTFGSAYGALASSTKIGYAFGGWFLDNSLQIEINSSTIVGTASNHTLYAKWTAKNPAHQDENGKWYVEMGYFPQSKVTNSTLKNNIKTSGTATGVTYSIAGQRLKEYKYGSDKYALYNGEYYEVEPVKYVLQSSSDLKDGFATEDGSVTVTAVSEKVVFASVWNEEYLGLGSGYLNSDLRVNFTAFGAESGMVEDYTQTKSFQLKNFKNANGSGGSSTYSLARAVSSESEIQSVFGDLSAEFSDLVADILGGYLFYWTRDVGSNLNNAQTISASGVTGTQMKMSEILGVRVTVNIKTLACE